MWEDRGVYIQKLYREKVGQNCFQELARVTAGTVKLEICGAGQQPTDAGKSGSCRTGSQGSLEAELLRLRGASVFFLTSLK